MLKFAVCPHDSVKNKRLWIEFVVFLGQKTGLPITLVNCFDFECYYRSFGEIDLSYSNPLDALKLEEDRGFVPVAGNDNYDEVITVAGEGADEDIRAMDGREVLAVENQFATYLGCKILKAKGINAVVVYRNSWQEVLKEVATGKYLYGFLYKDFWDQLSDLSKRGVKVIYESREGLASHLIMISPEMAQQKGVILGVLEEMQESEEGKGIMRGLRINRWYEVSSLDHIKELLQEVV